MKKNFVFVLIIIMLTGCTKSSVLETTMKVSITETPAQPTTEPTTTPINLKNEMSESLYSAIQEYLNIDEELTIDILESVEELNFNRLLYVELNNIEGIEYCRNLISLDLRNNKIADISSIGELTTLERLYLPGYDTGGEELTKLENLIELDYYGGRIEDYKYLTNLHKLEVFRCSSSKDVKNMPLFNKLRKLTIEGSYNNKSNHTREILKHFCKTNMIEELYLYGCDINLNDLSDYYNLKKLVISDYGHFITYSEFLPEFNELEDLTFFEVYFEMDVEMNLDEGELAELKEEDSPYYRKHIQKEEVLKNINKLNNLRSLVLGYCHLDSISELKDLDNLEYLCIGGNAIDDISVIKNYKKLKSLNISDTYIEDITVLEDLKHLEELDMVFCPNININELTGNNTIIDLDISLCEWEDNSFLEHWINLEILDMSYNEFQSIDVLLELPNLKKVDITGNPIVNGEEIISQLEAQGVEVIR